MIGLYPPVYGLIPGVQGEFALIANESSDLFGELLADVEEGRIYICVQRYQAFRCLGAGSNKGLMSVLSRDCRRSGLSWGHSRPNMAI